MTSSTPASTSTSALPAPVAPNAWHAFGGVWRLTFRRFMTPTQGLVFAGALALLLLIGFALTRTGHVRGFYNVIADLYLTIVTPMIAFVAAAGSIRDDLRPAVTDYVLIRPVRRPAFILFKFVAHVACLQVAFLVALVALMGLGVMREITSLASSFPWLLFAQALTVMAFSAFGFLCGALSSKYFLIGLAYAALVELGVGNIPTQINRLSMLRQINSLLHSVLPNVRPAGEPQDALTTIVVLVSISAVMVAVTAGVFAVRELSAGPTKE